MVQDHHRQALDVQAALESSGAQRWEVANLEKLGRLERRLLLEERVRLSPFCFFRFLLVTRNTMSTYLAVLCWLGLFFCFCEGTSSWASIVMQGL